MQARDSSAKPAMYSGARLHASLQAEVVGSAGGYTAQAIGLEYTTASRGAFTGTFTVLAVPMLVRLLFVVLAAAGAGTPSALLCGAQCCSRALIAAGYPYPLQTTRHCMQELYAEECMCCQVGLSGRKVPWTTWAAAAVALTGTALHTFHEWQCGIPELPGD